MGRLYRIGQRGVPPSKPLKHLNSYWSPGLKMKRGIYALCVCLSIFPREPSELSVRKVACFSLYGFKNVTHPIDAMETFQQQRVRSRCVHVGFVVVVEGREGGCSKGCVGKPGQFPKIDDEELDWLLKVIEAVCGLSGRSHLLDAL